MACNAGRAFFTDEQVKNYTLWTCSEVCQSLCFLLDKIFVGYGNSSIYSQIIEIPMDTKCTPLFEDLFLYCNEREFILNFDTIAQADVITAFNNTCDI